MITTTPSGLPEILTTFGDVNEPDFANRHIVRFDLPYPLYYLGVPVFKAGCHKLAVDNFVAVFTDIKNAGLQSLAQEYNGIYAPRAIRGYPKFPSTHSWGIAIDLNASKFPLGSELRQDPRIVDIFHKYGFFYGGDFVHRKDPMHFQLCDKY